MTMGATAFVAAVAFVVPIALSSSSSASPGDTTTTTTVSVSTTSSTMMAPTTTTTTIAPTTTTRTVSPPVNGEGIVVVGESGDRILAGGGVKAQAPDPVLAQTGSAPKPVWMAGIACLASGALALTFKRRRHLSLYQLRAKRS